MKKNLLLALTILLSGITVNAQNQTWRTEYNGQPWTLNTSKPNKVTNGLQGRHISLWASHGRYYDINKGIWKWQRPLLFSTTEDLYTQAIVLPYLIPMLQNAGAIVFSPRERDWQTNEVIVDNDTRNGYSEYNDKKRWGSTNKAGFNYHAGAYTDGENPFTAGTARKIKARKKDNRLSSVTYQPYLPESGKYAVYVSYQTEKKSVDDAEYIVFHKGQETHFKVNQKMGGGTWVYLGTFEFDKGSSILNSVVLTNHSSHRGVVTADAIRFGGGRGNIARGGRTSGLPRALEGARYYAQWAGAPRDVVSKSNGTNDYNDDINVRSLMTNWLAAGSEYVPEGKGGKVPFDLSLAVHSDAGYKADGSFVGTLGICTTQTGDEYLGDHLSRTVSKTFATELVNNVRNDINSTFHLNWQTRSVWDKNYSETRLPDVPSAIIETLSHQNFPDIKLGQDPNFKFVLARSIYKTILKYEARLHRTSYTVSPLAPTHFRMDYIAANKIRLQWTPVTDSSEPSAAPTSYNVYTSTDKGGFDNGVNVTQSYIDILLEPGKQFNFKVTACNRGGESFPSEVLSAYYQPGASKTVLVVNGFHRLSSPAVVDSIGAQGFNIEADPGVTYGPTLGWAGRQSNFDTAYMGKEGYTALGYGGEELIGKLIAGNDFDYVREHAEAIRSAGKYNIVSCSSKAIEGGLIDLSKYALVDLAFGLQKDDGHSLYYYKTFTPSLKKQLTSYLQHRGKLLVSGAYIASDMLTNDDRNWLAQTLKVAYAGTNQNNYNEQMSGLGMTFDIYRQMNSRHYGAYSPDNLTAADASGLNVMQYADGNSAAIAYQGADYSTFTMGFPIECIKDASLRNKIMRGILAYLLK